MLYIKRTNWFTVVELMVVITILTILSAISFVSFSWYSKDSRDATRVTNVDIIYNSLRTVKVTTWRYPIPDKYKEITYAWKVLWRHWIIWEWVSSYIQSSLFIDPKYQNKKKNKELYFYYWVLDDSTDFQIWTILEDDKNEPVS